MIILSATRTFERNLPPTVSKRARSGVLYERAFAHALFLARPPGATINRNPWFAYQDARAREETKFCCPDVIAFSPEDEFVTVFEVKRTWIPEAALKLQELYLPVVSRALGIPAVGVVVCKNLVPEAPRPATTISLSMLKRPNPGLYHWITNTPVRW